MRSLQNVVGQSTCVSTVITGFVCFLRFAEFGTIREADKAIQLLHNFEMGKGIKLGVKVSEKKEQREKRMAKKQEEEEYLSTLNCGRNAHADAEQTSFANGYELTSEEAKQCQQNPFIPSYKNQPPSAGSPQEPCGTGEEEEGHEGEGAEGLSLGESAGASSLRAAAMSSQTSPAHVGQLSPSRTAGPASPSSNSPPRACVVCGTQCTMQCTCCKAPYCSKKCQASDWPKHRLNCNKVITVAVKKGEGAGSGYSAQPGQGPTMRGDSPLVIREKESSEDEGFEIPTPPMEELVMVLQNQSQTPAAAAGSVQSPIRKSLFLPIMNQSQQIPPIANQPLYTPPVVNQPLHTPPVVNQAQQIPPIANQPLHTPPIANQAQQTPPIANQPLHTPPVANQAQQTPPIANQPLHTPPVANQAQQTPPIANQPLHTPPVANQAQQTPPVANQAQQTPCTPQKVSSQSPVPMQDRPAPVSVPPPPVPPPSSSNNLPLSLTEVLGVFQTSVLPLLSVPLGSLPPQRFNAVVTSAISCVRFSAVMMSVETKQALKQIQTCGTSTHLTAAEPLSLVVGSKVGYLDENKDLYRMEVLKIFPGCCKIYLRYYDFGGHFTTPMSRHQLLMLPEDIVTIPCLGHRCSLNGLHAKDNVGGDYFLSVVQAAPVQITVCGRHQTVGLDSVYYVCEGHLIDGSSTNLKQLMCGFLAKQTPAISPQSSFPATVNSVPGRPRHVPQPGRSPSKFPLFSSPRQPPASPGPHQPPASPSTDQYKLMHMARDVRRHQPPLNEDFVVMPIVVDSPTSLWVHMKHASLPNLHCMQEDLNREYGSSTAEVYSPSVGELCVARYCQDKQFYRAEVLCVNNNGTVDVRFVDFGNREMVLVSQVQHIRPIYLTLPIQALHFSLAGVEPSGHALSWSDNTITYLKDKILNQELTARVAEWRAGMYLVTLCDPDNPQTSLAETMANLGHCDKPSEKRAELPGRMPGVKTLQGPSPPSGAHPTRAASYRPPTPTPPVKYTSDAQPVLSLGSRPLQSSLGSRSFLTCKKVLPFGQSSEGGFKSMSESPSSPVTPPTTSPPPLGPSEGGETQPDAVESSASPRKLGEAADSSNYQGLTQTSAFSCSREVASVPVRDSVSLPSDSEHTVLVTSITSPNIFFVQKLDKEALTALLELSEQLNMLTLYPLPDPRPQDFCVANYTGDGMMYRGKVLKFSGSSCNVKFIDYGNLESVAVSDIYALPPECATLPAQAMLCSVNQYRQIGKREPDRKAMQHSPESLQHFKSLVTDKQVTLRVAMVLDSSPTLPAKYVVDLTVPTGEGEKDVLDLMVEAGYSLPRASPSKQKSSSRGKESQGGFGKGRAGEGSTRGGGFRQKGRENRSREEGVPSRPWGTQAGAAVEGREGSLRPLASVNPETRSQTEQKRSLGVPRENSAKPPAQSSQHSNNASSKADISWTPTSPSPQRSLAPSSTAFPPLSSLAVTELPSDTEYVEVMVIDVSHPPVLYVQIANQHYLQVISDLQTGLNSRDYPPPDLTPPPLDHVCCCRFPMDNLWYRAVVIGIRDGQCDVHFIDFGNKDTVPLANIAPCPKELLQVPVMAVQCSLNGVHPLPSSSEWLQEAIIFLQQKCLDRILLAKIESRDVESGLPHIQLIDTSSSNDVYVSAELVQAGLAAASPPGPSPVGVPPSHLPAASRTTPTTPTAAYTPVTHLPGFIFPETEEFEVLVVSVALFTELYVHPVTSDTAHNMGSFMTSITEYCTSQTTPPATPPSVGHFCLAQFSDGNWFRAKVESVGSGGSLDVLFVDFGNRETVSLSQIRPMAAHFVDLPVQVLQCGLCGVTAGEAMDPDPAACSLFNELVTSSTMTCRIVCHAPLLVDLVTQATGQSVRAELAGAGKLSLPPPDLVFSVPTSSLVPGSKSSVMITDVQGPGSFWLQSTESPNLPQLPSLMHKIGNYCCGPQRPSPRPPLLGELCCTQFSEDGVWYRARVVGFPSLSKCCVRFLDYGNCEVCTASAILPATPQLLSLPALAIHCALVGWEDQGEGEEAEQDAAQKFKSLAGNQMLVAVQKGKRKGQAVVELTGAEDGPLHQQL